MNLKSLVNNSLNITPIYTTKTKSTDETYKGISKQNYPKWAGWKIIKSYKSEGTIPADIQDSKLDVLVKNFYYIYYLDQDTD